MMTSMNVLGVAEIIKLVTSFLGFYGAAFPLYQACVTNVNNLENLIERFRLDLFVVLYDAKYGPCD